MTEENPPRTLLLPDAARTELPGWRVVEEGEEVVWLKPSRSSRKADILKGSVFLALMIGIGWAAGSRSIPLGPDGETLPAELAHRSKDSQRYRNIDSDQDKSRLRSLPSSDSTRSSPGSDGEASITDGPRQFPHIRGCA